MTAVLDALVKRNPLLGHGPRTHRTGITLAEAGSVTTRPRRRPLDVDAPRLHLGRDHR